MDCVEKPTTPLFRMGTSQLPQPDRTVISLLKSGFEAVHGRVRFKLSQSKSTLFFNLGKALRLATRRPTGPALFLFYRLTHLGAKLNLLAAGPARPPGA